MVVERRLVISPLVAEQLPESLERGGAVDQQRPVVVPDLVPEMTEHGSVGLSELRAPPLALSIVRLAQVDRDDAIAVAGHDWAVAAREQVELQRSADRQAQLSEPEQNPSLRPLRGAESPQAVGVEVAIVRTGAGQRAACAQLAGSTRYPVARRELGVGAANQLRIRRSGRG
jgi:hypothetical protein